MHAQQWAVLFFAFATGFPSAEWEWTKGGRKYTLRTPKGDWFLGVGLIFLTLALT